MPDTVNLYEAKTQLSRLVERASSGEEIIIAKSGTPMARLVPLAKPKRQPGMLRGRIPPDLYEPLPTVSPRRPPPGPFKGQFEIEAGFDDPLPDEILAAFGVPGGESRIVKDMTSAMRLLLDPHVFLWWLADDPRLDRVRTAIADATAVYVSAATIWSLSERTSEDMALPPFGSLLATNHFEPLAVTVEHVEAAATLSPGRADPTGRLLVAQAKVERLVLVAHDHRLFHYGGQGMVV